MPAESQLLRDFQSLRRQDPTLRAIDAAAQLGVAEGALVDARSTTDEVSRLAPRGPRFAQVMHGLKSVGPVMTLTRNEACVHETKGALSYVAIEGAMGQVTGAIDLRLFLNRWKVGYAIVEETKSGIRHSLQVFDDHGQSILKIYAQSDADMTAWHALVSQHTGESEIPTSFSPPSDPAPARPDSQVDVDDLRSRWRALNHSHDFFAMLREVGAGRQQALRLAGQDLAAPLPTVAIRNLLQGASASEVPIMCFVGNPGCIQIYTGPVERIAEMGPWLNVLDERFNLHLRQDKVAAAWLVRKPTASRGLITSIELFDANETMICQFFGSRPPGGPENPTWRSLAESLLSETDL